MNISFDEFKHRSGAQVKLTVEFTGSDPQAGIDALDDLKFWIESCPLPPSPLEIVEPEKVGRADRLGAADRIRAVSAFLGHSNFAGVGHDFTDKETGLKFGVRARSLVTEQPFITLSKRDLKMDGLLLAVCLSLTDPFTHLFFIPREDCEVIYRDCPYQKGEVKCARLDISSELISAAGWELSLAPFRRPINAVIQPYVGVSIPALKPDQYQALKSIFNGTKMNSGILGEMLFKRKLVKSPGTGRGLINSWRGSRKTQRGRQALPGNVAAALEDILQVNLREKLGIK